MRLVILIGILLGVGCSQTITAQDQSIDIPMYTSFDSIAPLFTTEDKIRVINFWATWCGPCVAEMPYVDGLNALYSKDEVEVILVSLDFARDKDKRVIPYIEKNKIQSDVVMLLDDKMHIWVDKVDPNWSGSIPLTCIVDKDGYTCYEQEFHSIEELTQLINTK